MKLDHTVDSGRDETAFQDDGLEIFSEHRDSAARALHISVGIVGGRGLRMSQNTRQTIGVATFSHDWSHKVAQANGTAARRVCVGDVSALALRRCVCQLLD